MERNTGQKPITGQPSDTGKKSDMEQTQPLDIGQKIRKSRNESGLTQEQVAEAISVSRQTISNWENNRSYPDIISVIKMSELYHVSLDYLLKGENDMTTYYDYLKESTDIVKSNDRKEKVIVAAAYIVVWSIAMIAFWFFNAADDAMGYSLMYLWLILPVTTFVTSLFIGKDNLWGRAKWAAAPILGVMYMLAAYGTFSMANNIAFSKVNVPDWGMVPVGMIISAIGIGVGVLLRKVKPHENKTHENK